MRCWTSNIAGILLLVPFSGCEQARIEGRGSDIAIATDSLSNDSESLVKMMILSEKTIEELIAEDSELDIFGMYKHLRATVHEARGRDDFHGVEAYERLSRRNDQNTFNILKSHLDDRRLGVTLTGADYTSMSWSAYYLLRGMLYYVEGIDTDHYERDQTRLGSDGRYHENPFPFGKRRPPRQPFAPPKRNWQDEADSPEKLKAWLEKRKEKTVDELRIEVLSLLFEAEESIGFPKEGDRERFLNPIKRELDELTKRRDK